MSWGENQSMAAKRAALRDHYRLPRFVYTAVELIAVEPNDRPGADVCPITGDPQVRALEVIPDFSFLLDRQTMRRVNAWDSPEAMERVGRFAAMAEPIATCSGHVAEVRVQFKIPQSRLDIIREEQTETTYFSGGWRSGKSFLAMQKWSRLTLKFGGDGRRAWLVGPERKNAWRLVESIYRGRAGTPALIPTHGRDEYKFPRSVLVRDRIAKSSKNSNDLEFHHLDGTSIEPFHARGGAAHLEGEAAFAILFDEARMLRDSAAFDIIRGRVMGDMGQVIVASVPDDEAPWLYEKVVAEAERQKHWAVPGVRMLTLSGYDNPWVPDEAIKRREQNETDPIVVEQKIYGKWTMRGLYAYSDVYDTAKHERDNARHDAEAWNLGEDITRHVTRATCRKVGDYIVGVDFNWDPQTRVIFKVFGQQGRAETWTLVALDEVVTTRADAITAAKELRRRAKGRYKGAVVVADCNGFHSYHNYGGRQSKHFDKFYYEAEGFRAVAPIHTKGKDRKTKHSNPDMGMSRTVIRQLMREVRFIINAGQCPRLVHAIEKAPNRRKRKEDVGTWIDREVYNLEDCVRYVAWRVFERFLARAPKKTRGNMTRAGARAS